MATGWREAVTLRSQSPTLTRYRHTSRQLTLSGFWKYYWSTTCASYNTWWWCCYDIDYDYEMVLLRHTISTMYHGIIFKSCKKHNILQWSVTVCHRRTNKESVLSADVGPPETNIIYRSKCNMPIYIIIRGYIIKIEIWFT